MWEYQLKSDRYSNPHLAITSITHWSSKYVSDVTFSLVIHMWQEGTLSLSCKYEGVLVSP